MASGIRLSIAAGITLKGSGLQIVAAAAYKGVEKIHSGAGNGAVAIGDEVIVYEHVLLAVVGVVQHAMLSGGSVSLSGEQQILGVDEDSATPLGV